MAALRIIRVRRLSEKTDRFSLHAVNHRTRCADLGLPDGSCRLDIDENRYLQVDR